MSNLNIGLITESISKSGFIPLSNIIELVYPLSNKRLNICDIHEYT